jgi:outer membrane protein OmpA-like peptidoglycan-associated protein
VRIRSEDNVPFAGNKYKGKLRYALLAGTTLAGAVLAQPILAGDALPTAEQPFLLAQVNPAVDPQTGRPLPKGAQPKAKQGAQPQGGQPKQVGQPPQGAQPKQVGQPPQGAQPPLGAQPKQVGQPPAGAQPKQVGQPPGGAQPKQFGQPPAGAQPKQFGQPPAGAQPKQFGQPPQGAQPKQFGQPPQVPGQPAPGGAPPATPSSVPAQPVAPAAPQHVGRPPAAGGQPGWGGHVDQLRSQRRERADSGGRLVIEEPGRRIIVREGNTTIIRNDDNERFRRWGAPRFEQRGHEHYAYIARPGGYQIINVTDADGRLLRRVRRGPDGREIILIDNRRGPGFGTGVAVGAGVGLAAGVLLGLAAPVVTIPRERYIVDVSAAPRPLLYETLEAPPVVAIERPYSLDEIRYNVALRDRMRRIDIDSITFESGSWEVGAEQYGQLEAIGGAIRRVIERNPDEVFMIEGHTDAVGADVDNLSLSDRRAESVAVILTDAYQIPPENLVTQGYGEQHPKIPDIGPSRENRRVAVRRITPLLNGAVASR